MSSLEEKRGEARAEKRPKARHESSRDEGEGGEKKRAARAKQSRRAEQSEAKARES